MGTLMAAICDGDKVASIAELVELMLDNSREDFTAFGGFVVSNLGDTIYPSCCATLNAWKEWRVFLDGGPSPWLGHDPGGWAELVDDRVVVWSDGALNDPRIRTGSCVNVTRDEFDHALKIAEHQVVLFFDQLPEWLEITTGSSNPEIVQKVLNAFSIDCEGTRTIIDR